MKAANKEYLFKLVIIGDAATGKSSLLRRYCENAFGDKYVCTVGVDFHIKILKMKDGRLVKLQIWDTAGQERFKVMTKSYYRSAKACLIVYDTTRKETFENVRAWAEQYGQSNGESFQNKQSVVIMGNKKDLVDQRQVDTDAAMQLSQDIGCKFFEVSAKEGGEEISQIFFSLAELLLANEDANAAKAQAEVPPSRNSLIISKAKSTMKKKKGCC